MCNCPLGRGFPGTPSSKPEWQGWAVPAPQIGPRYNPPPWIQSLGGTHGRSLTSMCWREWPRAWLQMLPTQGSPGHSPARLTATLALGKPALAMPTPHIPADALPLIFPDPPGRVHHLFSHIALETVSTPLWHSMHCAVIFFKASKKILLWKV